jgi:hypothetical protein
MQVLDNAPVRPKAGSEGREPHGGPAQELSESLGHRTSSKPQNTLSAEYVVRRLGVAGVPVMATLDKVDNAKKTEEAEQAKETSQARQAKQTLAPGNETEEAEETQEA